MDRQCESLNCCYVMHSLNLSAVASNNRQQTCGSVSSILTDLNTHLTAIIPCSRQRRLQLCAMVQSLAYTNKHMHTHTRSLKTQNTPDSYHPSQQTTPTVAEQWYSLWLPASAQRLATVPPAYCAPLHLTHTCMFTDAMTQICVFIQVRTAQICSQEHVGSQMCWHASAMIAGST